MMKILLSAAIVFVAVVSASLNARHAKADLQVRGGVEAELQLRDRVEADLQVRARATQRAASASRSDAAFLKQY